MSKPIIDIHTIDIAALTTVPILTAAGFASLIKSLRAVAPKAPPEPVQRADKRMLNLLGEAEGTLVARLGDEVDLRLERAFDNLADRLWIFQRMLFEYWELYEHEGTGLLTAEDRDEIDIDQCRELGVVAADLNARIYGGGTDFLRSGYSEQATFMASRLQLIGSKISADTYEEIVGPRAAKFVKICQARYEAMVAARGSRQSGPIGDLRELRQRMTRAISLYSMAVAGMLDEDVPESAEVVLRALLPNVLARVQRGSSTSVATEPVETVVQVELDAAPVLEAEEPADAVEELDGELEPNN